jgi:hypothetical protein
MSLDADIDALRVQPGDAITARLWNQMVDAHEALLSAFGKLTAGKGVRVNKSSLGLTIVADSGSSAFVGAFKVRLSGAAAVTVGAGTVNGLTPKINGLAIDGLDASGKQSAPPKLAIAQDGSRSWVCIRAKVSDDLQLDPEDNEALTIEHVTDPLLIARQRAEGLHVLAVIVWKDKRPALRQVVFHDQKHIAEQGKHYFSQAS